MRGIYKRKYKRRYSKLRHKSIGSFRGSASGGSTRRDFRPDAPSYGGNEYGEYDPADSVSQNPQWDAQKDELRRRRLTDDAYRRAMSGHRESGVRYSFSYGYY